MSFARVTATALFAALALTGSQALAAAPTWQLEQPPPPPGAQFKTALGAPGDLVFLSRNRGLLAVAGNGSTVPPGLFSYDGAEWHQLSTVCGGGDSVRIAFAAPREFWTVTEPSLPRAGAGTALCHFKNGQVIASYSTPLESADPFRQMLAAACNGPNDCWFGGAASQDPTGSRIGAFHLHWNGSTLETAYAPQGRAVSDMRAHGGTIFETVVVGPAMRALTAPPLADPEFDPLDPAPDPDPDKRKVRPRLVHRIVAGRFANDPFVLPGEPSEGADLLAIDGDASQLWAVGGGAASGPAAATFPDFYAPRPPLALRLEDDAWREVALEESAFAYGDRFVDAAAVPGTTGAWAAVQSVFGAGAVNDKATVAHVDADGTTTVESVPADSLGRGSAAKIAFTAPNDGWLVTSAGWLFHYSDGTRPPRDTDPAYQGTITFRPNEAAEQFVPDRPPADDSQLFAPPPLDIQQAEPPVKTRRLSALLRRVRTKRRGMRLIVRFTLVRKARVSLIARRKGRVVARTKPRLMRPGRHKLQLRLSRRRWPQRLAFSAREPGAAPVGGDGGDSGDTVTTGFRASRGDGRGTLARSGR